MPHKPQTASLSTITPLNVAGPILSLPSSHPFVEGPRVQGGQDHGLDSEARSVVARVTGPGCPVHRSGPNRLPPESRVSGVPVQRKPPGPPLQISTRDFHER